MDGSRSEGLGAAPGALVAAGAVLVATVGALVGLGLVVREPSFLGVLAIGGALGLFLLWRPDWIVPVFVGVTWAALPGRVFGGLPSPVEAGGLLLVGYGAWRALATPRLAANTLVVMAFLGVPLVVSALISPAGVADPSGDLRELLFLFIAALCVSGAAGAERAATVLVVTALVLGVGGIWSVIVGPTELFPLVEEPAEVIDREAPRAGGPFGEPNFYALSLAALTPLALYLVAAGGRGRWLGGAALVAIAGGILAAGSRGAVVAMLFALVAVAVATPSRQLRLAAATTVLVAALLVPIFASQAGSSATRSVGGRATENQIALAMVEDYPVAGVGPNRFEDYYRDYSRRIGDDPRPQREAHSLPLEIAAEQGIVGILGWLLAGFFALGYAVSNGVWTTRLGRALLLSTATYLVGSLFLHGSQLRLPFILVGLTLAYAAGLAERGRFGPPRSRASV